jgi:starch phosphorylase
VTEENLPADHSANNDTTAPASSAGDIGTEFPPTRPLAAFRPQPPPHTVDGFVKEYLHELTTGQGVTLDQASQNDQYLALARTIKNYLMTQWLESNRRTAEAKQKMVGYLSAEYLLGRQLENSLLATDMDQIAEEGLKRCGISLAT